MPSFFMDAQTLKQLIEQGLPGATAQVYGADGVHFEARVTASAFAGKPTLFLMRYWPPACGRSTTCLFRLAIVPANREKVLMNSFRVDARLPKRTE